MKKKQRIIKRPRMNKAMFLESLRPKYGYKIEKIDAWTYKVTLNAKDAQRLPYITGGFEIESASAKLSDGSVYFIRFRPFFV